MDNQNKLGTLIGEKIKQSQRFNEKQERIPVSILKMGPCVVTQVKNKDKDGYDAIQLGFGQGNKKTLGKPELGHIAKAGIKEIPRILIEVRTEGIENSVFKIGQVINVDEVFKTGDLVNVSGVAKGKGFAGVIKRHHFKGGPRTHGQSDRERAPGSIGQTTTPGRVYKGKRMAGRLGGNKVTVSNLKVIEINSNDNTLTISGLIPGMKNTVITVTRD